MARRKGEKPVARPLQHYRTEHPVYGLIERDGEFWLDAWGAQMSTPLARLAQITGIPFARLMTIRPGAEVSRAEVDAFARAWSVSSEDLIRSIGTASPITD